MGQGASGEKIEDRYFLQKVKLGQGSFGVVWRAIDRQTNGVVAVKQLDKAKMPSRGVRREDIEREIHMMQAAKHVNITQLHGTFEDGQAIYLALEYCDGGDFGDKVKEKGMNLEEAEAAVMMRQICAAIGELHSKSICHRDIKPDNFMVHGEGILKLTDFGLALSLPRGKLLTEKCGTPAFMAPEQHRLPRNSRGYSFAVDMWAAGVSMYMIMFGGRHPFLTSSNTLDNQRLLVGGLDFAENQNAGFFGLGGGGKERYSDMCRSVCRHMVTPDPARRMTADDAMRNAWVNPERRRTGAAPAGPGAGVPPAAPPAVAEQQIQPPANRQPDARPNWGWPFEADGAGGAPPKSDGRVKVDRENQELKAQNDALRAEVNSAQAQRGKLEKQLTGMQGMQEQFMRGVFGGPSSAAMPATQSGFLQAQFKCRYFSDSQSQWLPATVQGYNNDGTYNLDVKPYAMTNKISPRPDGPAYEAWPPGTWVVYNSSSVNSWIPSTVLSFNEGDGTYNLECRDHAPADKIRPRIEDASGMPQASLGVGSQQGLARTITRKPTQAPGAFDGDGYRDGSQVGNPGAGRASVMPQDPNVQLPPPLLLTDLPEVFCMITDPRDRSQTQWLMAVVQSFHAWDGTCNVMPVPPAMQERLTVQVDTIRSPGPNDSRRAWPPGTKVEYYSQSLSNWIPAMVFSYNIDDKTYNLDVRDHAAPDKVRPRITG